MKNLMLVLPMLFIAIIYNSVTFACEIKIVDEGSMLILNPLLEEDLEEINQIAYLFEEGFERNYLGNTYKIVNKSFKLKNQK